MQEAFIINFMSVRASNPARSSYRLHERNAALKKFFLDQSDANKAVLDEEFRLASRHDEQMAWLNAGIVFAALLGIEGWVVYLRISRRKAVVT